jgi:hypothetical protein
MRIAAQHGKRGCFLERVGTTLELVKWRSRCGRWIGELAHIHREQIRRWMSNDRGIGNPAHFAKAKGYPSAYPTETIGRRERYFAMRPMLSSILLSRGATGMALACQNRSHGPS